MPFCNQLVVEQEVRLTDWHPRQQNAYQYSVTYFVKKGGANPDSEDVEKSGVWGHPFPQRMGSGEGTFLKEIFFPGNTTFCCIFVLL